MSLPTFLKKEMLPACHEPALVLGAKRLADAAYTVRKISLLDEGTAVLTSIFHQ